VCYKIIDQPRTAAAVIKKAIDFEDEDDSKQLCLQYLAVSRDTKIIVAEGG
jgi:hypothetical protein